MDTPCLLEFRKRFPSIKTGEEVLDMEFPPQEWLIKDFLPFGSAILAGPPKLGKSYFVLSLIKQISEEDHEVFYYAGEDDARRIQRRMKELNIDSKGIFLHPGRDAPLTAEGKKPIDEIRAMIEMRPKIKSIFIDHMTLILSRKSNPKHYDDFVHELKPWSDLANNYNLSIFMVHHTRKEINEAEHNPFNSILGSQGIMASFDTVLIMIKAPDGNGAVLRVTGKDVEEKEYRLSKQKVSWKIEGLESVASLGNTQAKIHSYVKTNPNSSWSDIKTALGIDGAQVSRTIDTLLKNNIIEKVDNRYNSLL